MNLLKTKSVLVILIISMLTVSCKGEAQKKKEQNIKNGISEMRAEMDSIKQSQLPDTMKTNTPKIDKSQTDIADKIIGVWEVKNDYYMGIYEIEKFEGKYIGKIHYYNDGKTEYEGKNTENDYFIEGLIYENGLYKNGKMHMPDGSYYQIIIKQKNNDELEVKMTVQGSPYTEIWKRQKTQ